MLVISTYYFIVTEINLNKLFDYLRIPKWRWRTGQVKIRSKKKMKNANELSRSQGEGSGTKKKNVLLQTLKTIGGSAAQFFYWKEEIFSQKKKNDSTLTHPHFFNIQISPLICIIHHDNTFFFSSNFDPPQLKREMFRSL